jgi:hypothetical protein
MVARVGRQMRPEIQSLNRARTQQRQGAHDLRGFNFGAAAELFPSRSKKGKASVTYRRFDTAAEAVRFAVEEIPAPALLGACLEVNEVRFGADEIHSLYASDAYPLPRPAAVE